MFAFPCSILAHIEQIDCSLLLSGTFFPAAFCLVCTVQSSSMGRFDGDGESFKLGTVKQEEMVSVAVHD